MPITDDDRWQALDDDEKAAALDALRNPPAPAEAVLDDDPDNLSELLEETLTLRYRDRSYTLQSVDIDTGLTVQAMFGVGASALTGGKANRSQVNTIEDADELELYKVLLGGRSVLSDGKPDPRYDERYDVWAQLREAGASFVVLQHFGTTAMLWTALGRDTALAYWRDGGRPKAQPAPAPVKAPQDHRPKAKATTTPKRANGSSTRQKRSATKREDGVTS